MIEFPKDANGIALSKPGILKTPRGLVRLWSLDYDPYDGKWLVMYSTEEDEEHRSPYAPTDYACKPYEVSYLGQLVDADMIEALGDLFREANKSADYLEAAYMLLNIVPRDEVFACYESKIMERLDMISTEERTTSER